MTHLNKVEKKIKLKRTRKNQFLEVLAFLRNIEYLKLKNTKETLKKSGKISENKQTGNTKRKWH